MKLEHLMQAYNFNKIPVTIEKEIEESAEDKAGVIKFNEDVFAAYTLDSEGFVCGINLFANGIKKKDLNIQLKHTEDLLMIIQKTIELLCDTTQEETNDILKRLGIFNGAIKEKAVERLEYIYKVKAENGLLNLLIIKK